MKLLGIDIGGTKTSVCAGNEKGELFASRRMPMDHREAVDVFERKLIALCREVLDAAALKLGHVTAIGISAPGPLNIRQGVLISPPNNPGWRNVPITAMVRNALGRPVFLNNDANACALAEAAYGSHRGARNLIYLTFSTGLGGGIILNGQLVQGSTDTGGEVGHQVLDPKGPRCGCGQRGCWEAYVGGRRVAERLQAKIRRRGLKTRIVEKAGGRIEDIDLRALEAAARDGDPLALAEWDRFTERAAQGIGNLIMCLNPDVVVLGTIAIQAGEFAMRPIRQKLKKYAWQWPLAACQIVPSALGGRIGDLSAIAVATSGLAFQPAPAAIRRRAQVRAKR